MSLLTSYVSSPIYAHVDMHSSLPSERSGSFHIDAATTGAATLLTDFVSAPVDSRLEVWASTHLGDAEVRLPSSYEGELGLSNNGRMDLSCQDSKVLDPAGEGRKRDLRYVAGVNSIRGSLAWIPQHTPPGSGKVVVKTTKGNMRVVCPDDMK
jgi:hypothetical protein